MNEFLHKPHQQRQQHQQRASTNDDAAVNTVNTINAPSSYYVDAVDAPSTASSIAHDPLVLSVVSYGRLFKPQSPTAFGV